MQANLDWLNKNHANLVKDLADLVAVRSVSTDGEHQKEIEQSAELTCEQMRRAGLQKTEILRCNGSNPYAYGEWLGAPGKPTVFLYAHHDVQPVHQADVDAGRWHSDPWKLTPRDGRLFARGSADDKAAITDRKSTRLNSSHLGISYAVFCFGPRPALSPCPTRRSSDLYAYGEWLGAPGKPTVFLYAHHDVQPVHQDDVDAGRWHSDPWKLTPRDGRLFARGSADDKAAITAQLGPIAAFLKTRGSLPVNVKMVVEGEEEVGSSNLDAFFRQYKDRIQSDVIVVCDTENIEVGLPSITYSLRGIVAALVEVQSAALPVHSGMAGGLLADAALALDAILARLYSPDGKFPIPHLYDGVRPMTDKERQVLHTLPADEAKWRQHLGVLPGVRFAGERGCHPYEQTWRKPAVTIIAQEASSIKGASNQVLPKAAAIVSCRIVPDQDPEEVFEHLKAFLTQ